DRQALEALPVGDDLLVGRGHLVRQLAEDRVVLQQVGERRVVGDVVHRDDFDIGLARAALSVDRPPEVASDPPEPVYTHTYRHAASPCRFELSECVQPLPNSAGILITSMTMPNVNGTTTHSQAIKIQKGCTFCTRAGSVVCIMP